MSDRMTLPPGENMHCHEDWMRQARRDLRHAENARREEDLEWTCFAAQQAAGKAVRALLQARGIASRTPATTFMAAELSSEDAFPRDVLDGLQELDMHYITSRYPDAHSAGAPLDYYTRATADRAVDAARKALNHVADRIDQAGPSRTEVTGRE